TLRALRTRRYPRGAPLPEPRVGSGKRTGDRTRDLPGGHPARDARGRRTLSVNRPVPAPEGFGRWAAGSASACLQHREDRVERIRAETTSDPDDRSGWQHDLDGRADG